VTAYIDGHVHPPVAEFVEGPLAPYLPGLEAKGFSMEPMETKAIADYYRAREARAVLLGWDAESVTNRRPFGNSDVAAMVETAPDVFWGLGAVDPAKGAAAVAQVHEAYRLGLPGISVHPSAQGSSPGDRTTYPVWEAAADHEMICLFHTGTTELGAGMPGGAGIRLEAARPMGIDAVAARLPGLRIVLAHAGTLWRDEAFAVATHKANVYLCLSGAGVAGDEALRAAIGGPLARRVIFGSGYPFGDPESGVAEWAELGLPEPILRRVLHDNALDLMAVG
jgi:predicted TIM-barrel fold metal-dependent hydrolase